MEKEFFKYLDELSDSGVSDNMLPVLLQEDFGISKKQAELIVIEWKSR